MLHLRPLSKLLLALFFIFAAGVHAGETKWEIATLFLGNGEDSVFQNDVDKNILELSTLDLGSQFNLGIYRELDGESLNYFPNYKSNQHQLNLSDILFRKNLNHYSITGTLTKSRNPNIPAFLKSFFRDPQAKKALIIYSHGLGPSGLKNYKTRELKNILDQAKIHFDILWFDSCFMANLEFLYEIKDYSTYSIASEEAEFSAGLPFQYLNQLTQHSDVKSAAIEMAANFVESYSYLKAGVQRSSVKTSSATITVFDNAKLVNLVDPLRTVSEQFKNMPPQEFDELIHSLQRKFVMEDKSMVDLGNLLIELRKINRRAPLDAIITKAIRLLGIESVKSLKQTIKVKLQAPAPNAILVYGFNDWTVNKAPDNFMKVDGYILGPSNQRWPYQTMGSNSKTLYPFFPGIYSFNYYFQSPEGKILTKPQSIGRTDDVIEEKNTPPDSPIVYSAYTQQIGTRAERYSGLNISMPNEIPSLDYYELKFNQLAQWLRL